VYRQGHVEREGAYVDGAAHGAIRFIDESGRLLQEGPYEHGWPQGRDWAGASVHDLPGHAAQELAELPDLLVLGVHPDSPGSGQFVTDRGPEPGRSA
jgi:hypothetical protein